MNVGSKFKLIVVSILSLMTVACGQEFELQRDVLERPRVPFNDSDVVYDPEYVDFSDLHLPDRGAFVDQDNEDQDDEPQNQQEQPPKTNVGANDPSPNPAPMPTPSPDPKQPQPNPPDSDSKTPGKFDSGWVSSTVYYIPIYYEKRNCKENELSVMKEYETNKTLMTFCKSEVANCAMQGSCYYATKNGLTLFSHAKNIKDIDPRNGKQFEQPRFFINPHGKKCPQGIIKGKYCLDPYRSIAADLSIYPRGTVILIEALRGKRLPNGEIHDGYFIVRDSGGGIKNKGRFDFFIGFDDFRKNPRHPFVELGFTEESQRKYKFQRVTGARADEVKALRAYPNTPVAVNSRAEAFLGDILADLKNPVTLQNTSAFYNLH